MQAPGVAERSVGQVLETAGGGRPGVLEDGDIDDLGHRPRDDLREIGALALVDHVAEGLLVVLLLDVGDVGQGLAVKGYLKILRPGRPMTGTSSLSPQIPR